MQDSIKSEIIVEKGVMVLHVRLSRFPNKLRDAARLANQYGGKAEAWSKITSQAYKAKDGSIFQIHGYKNQFTGQIVELKTVMDKRPKQ